MTYDKETRKELMEDELREDKIREHSNEINDGSLDTFIDENKKELIASFIDEYNDEWVSFCKTNFNEVNEE